MFDAALQSLNLRLGRCGGGVDAGVFIVLHTALAWLGTMRNSVILVHAHFILRPDAVAAGSLAIAADLALSTQGA
jgi:hypothetical protein